MRLVHAELLKLVTTRLLLWLGFLVAGLAVLVISLEVSQTSIAGLTGANKQRDVLTFAGVSALISAILGIVSSAGEYAHGTASHTFLAAPVRERVVAAKLAAAAVAGAGLAAFTAAAVWGLAALWLAGRSVPLELASRGAAELLGGVLLAAALAGAIGVGFGAVLRRQTPAIVVALVWLLVAEPLLGVAGAQKYGPGHAIASVVNAGRHSRELLDFGPGLALSLAYVAVLALLGTVVVKRSDVS